MNEDKQRTDIQNLIDFIGITIDEWEEEPAKELINKRIIYFSRNIFQEGALFGYDNGLSKNSININEELDKRGFVIMKEK